MSRQRAKGTAYETALLPILRERFPEAERTGSAAQSDGDFRNTGNLVIEAKNHKSIELADFMDQVKRASARAGGIPVLIVKRRNQGVGRSYVVMELQDWVSLVGDKDGEGRVS